jgi:hypothetical protein
MIKASCGIRSTAEEIWARRKLIQLLQPRHTTAGCVNSTTPVSTTEKYRPTVKSSVGRRRIDALMPFASLFALRHQPNNAIGQLARPSRAAPCSHQPLTILPVIFVVHLRSPINYRRFNAPRSSAVAFGADNEAATSTEIMIIQNDCGAFKTISLPP